MCDVFIVMWNSYPILKIGSDYKFLIVCSWDCSDGLMYKQYVLNLAN